MNLEASFKDIIFQTLNDVDTLWGVLKDSRFASIKCSFNNRFFVTISIPMINPPFRDWDMHRKNLIRQKKTNEKIICLFFSQRVSFSTKEKQLFTREKTILNVGDNTLSPDKLNEFRKLNAIKLTTFLDSISEFVSLKEFNEKVTMSIAHKICTRQ